MIAGYTYKIFNNSSKNKSVDEGRARIRKLKKNLIYTHVFPVNENPDCPENRMEMKEEKV